MAEIVGAMSVPHLPFLPMRIQKEPDSWAAREYAVMAEELARLSPDVVVAFSPDHVASFFFDNLPVFAVPIVDRFTGATDGYPVVEADRTVPSHKALGAAIYHHLLRHDFDPARVERFEADHSVIVPLQLMNVARDLPVVPLVVNALCPPLPNAGRVHAFGRAVGDAIRAFEEPLRVLILADGGINQEVGGPRSAPGRADGAPDGEWLDNVTARLRAGEVIELVRESTPERIAHVSNAGGELFTVLALLGAIGDPPAEHFNPEHENGIAFGLWKGVAQ
jgi:aromatic ring-opening dioxygenase catalytic subunit (LigB family)